MFGLHTLFIDYGMEDIYFYIDDFANRTVLTHRLKGYISDIPKELQRIIERYPYINNIKIDTTGPGREVYDTLAKEYQNSGLKIIPYTFRKM